MAKVALSNRAQLSVNSSKFDYVPEARRGPEVRWAPLLFSQLARQPLLRALGAAVVQQAVRCGKMERDMRKVSARDK